MKRFLIAIAVLIGLGVAYYLISPLWRVVEVQDSSPLDSVSIQQPTQPEPMMDDMEENIPEPVREKVMDLPSMNDLPAEEKAAFMEEMEKMKAEVIEMVDAMPEGPTLTRQGTFVAADHEVAGQALFIENGDERILRFEDFETVNGPNLHIYLATDASADDYIDLGPIRGTRGNVNYTVPADIDIEQYDHVLVWCVPFGVLFSYADLMAL